MEIPAASKYQKLLELGLAEDLGPGDITSQLVISEASGGFARIEARQSLVACGLFVAADVFRAVDSRLEIECLVAEGDLVQADAVLMRLSGPMRGILGAERTALNFLGRLCGIATLTHRHVQAVAHTKCQIVDTRKTLPGWRILDKFAVSAGGGVNHRMGLYDGILLKDNHIAAAGGVENAVENALRDAPEGIRVQVEVESPIQAEAACRAGADFLLLDNRTPAQVAEIVQRLEAHILLEASGGIHLENVAKYAEAGVQRISLGALTHSAPAADVALEIETEESRS
jgi:nicotinate-nucleotide pyrophosphorylase (carboxylating)